MRHPRLVPFAVLSALLLAPACTAQAAYRFSGFRAKPPIHRYGSLAATPSGLAPAQIKAAYHLPQEGGHGTIAIIDAYDASTIEHDLSVFDAAFGLTECTKKNGCLEVKKMSARMARNSGWALETALDVEWAHAIAPQAKILLIEAATPSGKNLLAAIDEARKRTDVVAVSMSWGGGEFQDETSLDAHFSSPHDAVFFASSGDNGAGVSWPAVSPRVVAVGGTTLRIAKSSGAVTETAWSGSGGGVSLYETQPEYQKSYDVKKSNGRRAVPDVSYDADPQTGYAVYHAAIGAKKGWYVLGGTSAGAPQWAAIRALGLSASNDRFYGDKDSAANGAYFRDIKSGANGDCLYFCEARRRYDEVTGLGSPLTVDF